MLPHKNPPPIPESITPELKMAIAKKLEDRGATLPCPRCGSTKFSIIDGLFNQTLQTTLDGFVLGGPSIPTAIVACNKCGYLSQHALGALGLLSLMGEAKKTASGEGKNG